MENIYIYDYKKRDKDIGHYTFVDGQLILKKSDVTVVILADANDLRYYNYGVQAIWSISIALPFAHIQKTLKRTDDTDFSKVETYINTKLKKYGFRIVFVGCCCFFRHLKVAKGVALFFRRPLPLIHEVIY